MTASATTSPGVTHAAVGRLEGGLPGRPRVAGGLARQERETKYCCPPTVCTGASLSAWRDWREGLLMCYLLLERVPSRPHMAGKARTRDELLLPFLDVYRCLPRRLQGRQEGGAVFMCYSFCRPPRVFTSSVYKGRRLSPASVCCWGSLQSLMIE